MAGSQPGTKAVTSVVMVIALLLVVVALWAFVIVDYRQADGGRAAAASTNSESSSSAGSSAGSSGEPSSSGGAPAQAEDGWTMDDAREALAADDSRVLVLTDSTGDGYDEWVHLWADNQELPAATWLTNSESGYSDAFDATRVWAAGMPEATATYPTEHWEELWPAQEPNLVIVSYGHTYDSGEVATAELEELRADLAERAPEAPIVIVLQNPSVDDANAHVREAIAQWAEGAGLPTINITQAFEDSGLYPADLRLDAFHPSTAGSQLWAETVGAALNG